VNEISREDARKYGLDRYFTGKLCNRGHASERYTNSGHCIQCLALKRSEWSEKNKERRKETNALWYKKNRDKVLGRSKKWQDDNRERVHHNAKVWARKNREKRSASARKRHAIKRGASGHHTEKDVFKILDMQNNRCAFCSKKVARRAIDYHVDHIYPLSKGGSNGPENIQILCILCNLKKSNKDPVEYAEERGLLI